MRAHKLESTIVMLTSYSATGAITAFLLDLHERAHDLGYREFQRFCMERLKELLPFDSGLLAMGTIHEGLPRGTDVMLHGQPAEFMQSWERVKHEDRVAVQAFLNPGRTANHAVAGPIFDGCEAVRAHCRAWGLAHVLCTTHLAPNVGLYWVMSLYRADPGRPFSEEERGAKELIVPHVFAAARRARLGQMRGTRRLPDAHGEAGMIVDDEGLILEADESVAEILRVEWPGWSGPYLPRELARSLGATPSCRLALRGIVVRSQRVDGVRLLHARRRVVADCLTPREREIAEAFSLGETHRELGDRLGISPNTARRHLANIYSKLGISSKVELDRMLSGLT